MLWPHVSRTGYQGPTGCWETSKGTHILRLLWIDCDWLMFDQVHLIDFVLNGFAQSRQRGAVWAEQGSHRQRIQERREVGHGVPRHLWRMLHHRSGEAAEWQRVRVGFTLRCGYQWWSVWKNRIRCMLLLCAVSSPSRPKARPSNSRRTWWASSGSRKHFMVRSNLWASNHVLFIPGCFMTLEFQVGIQRVSGNLQKPFT